MNPMYSGHNTLERPTNPNASQRLALTFADRKGGFPHSEISGSKGARASPELIAACHVLHRLSTPRHPSEALICLIVLSKTHARTRRFPSRDRHGDMRLVIRVRQLMSSSYRPVLESAGVNRRRTDPSFTMSCPRLPRIGKGREFYVFPDRGDCALPPTLVLLRLSLAGKACGTLYGGARRDRTDDLMLAKHALYQLSYGPSFALRATEGLPSVARRAKEGGPSSVSAGSVS